MTESGFPSNGIPLVDLAICVDDELAFRASDGKCPSCGTTVGWMLLPRKFVAEPEKDESPGGQAGAFEKGR
jgi:hypothetical protein